MFDLFPLKLFFSTSVEILPFLTPYSIRSATTSTNCCAKIPIIYSQYGVLSVLANNVTIFLSRSEGCTSAVRSLRL